MADLSNDKLNQELNLRDDAELASLLRTPRLEHAIGVIYRPETERISHDFRARLPSQLDAVIHIDRTRAVEPLECSSQWVAGELPETFSVQRLGGMR